MFLGRKDNVIKQFRWWCVFCYEYKFVFFKKVRENEFVRAKRDGRTEEKAYAVAKKPEPIPALTGSAISLYTVRLLNKQAKERVMS